MPGTNDPSYDGILGRQYEATGRPAAARILLEKAMAAGAAFPENAAESLVKSGGFARAITRFGIKVTLLNLSGDAYLGWNRPAEARSARQRPLGLNPDQPEIRKKIEKLKIP